MQYINALDQTVAFHGAQMSDTTNNIPDFVATSDVLNLWN